MDHADMNVPAFIAETDRGAAAPAGGREALWYPVGIALGLLAAINALLLCFSGGWTG